MSTEGNISVVIPSFNRARLLPFILPSYMQPEAAEVILVDDCSTDNTREVVEALQQTYPTLKYYRMPVNSRQAAAKNKGIALASQPYIYFGDDDSFIIPGTLARLMATMQEKGADMVAAKAIYMDPGEKPEEWPEIVSRRNRIGEQVLDMNRLEVDFTTSVAEPSARSLSQACFLVRTELAQKVLFDAEAYTMTCYREETDFIVRAIAAGSKLYYNSDAVQINLPREETAGGTRSWSRLKYEVSCIANNRRFLSKNHVLLREHYGVSWSAARMQLYFVMSRVPYLLRAIVQTLFPGLYGILKKWRSARK